LERCKYTPGSRGLDGIEGSADGEMIFLLLYTWLAHAVAGFRFSHLRVPMNTVNQRVLVVYALGYPSLAKASLALEGVAAP